MIRRYFAAAGWKSSAGAATAWPRLFDPGSAAHANPLAPHLAAGAALLAIDEVMTLWADDPSIPGSAQPP